MPSVTIRPADDGHLPSANTCISRWDNNFIFKSILGSATLFSDFYVQTILLQFPLSVEIVLSYHTYKLYFLLRLSIVNLSASVWPT